MFTANNQWSWSKNHLADHLQKVMQFIMPGINDVAMFFQKFMVFEIIALALALMAGLFILVQWHATTIVLAPYILQRQACSGLTFGSSQQLFALMKYLFCRAVGLDRYDPMVTTYTCKWWYGTPRSLYGKNNRFFKRDCAAWSFGSMSQSFQATLLSTRKPLLKVVENQRIMLKWAELQRSLSDESKRIYPSCPIRKPWDGVIILVLILSSFLPIWFLNIVKNVHYGRLIIC